MRTVKFTAAQIVNALKEFDSGTPATTLARRLGIHVNTLRAWKDKYAGLQTGDPVSAEAARGRKRAKCGASLLERSSNSTRFAT